MIFITLFEISQVVLEMSIPPLSSQFFLEYFMLLHHLEIQHGRTEGSVAR
jgi:hypothetical protein